MELESRIIRCVTAVQAKQHTYVDQSSVALLRLLSGPLKLELSKEVMWPILCKCPFFHIYYDKSSLAFSHLCFLGTAEKHLCQDDTLFASGTVCGHMFFVKSGVLSYIRRDLSDENAEVVRAGQCF